MRIFVLFPLLIVLGISYSVAQDAKLELRTWEAINGNKLEAELVSVSDGQVSLKMKTGKIFKVPLNKLSKADQEFLTAKSSPKEPTKGEAPVSPHLKYEVKDSEVTITGCAQKASGALIIPATIEGKPVTSIAGWDVMNNPRRLAFKNCTNLTSITIPDSVTSIGDDAFNDCTSLTSITIPDSVTSIGNGAFAGCSSLTSITIPNGVTSIGRFAFFHCSNLTSITIGNSVTSIGEYAFCNCSNLTSITIPDSVTSIGNEAFNDCTSLTSITIGEGVTSIGLSAFGDCNSLTSITIPDSVTSIGPWAFAYCDMLTSITIGEGVTSIGLSAFGNCRGLTTIEVDAGNVNYTEVNEVLFNKEKTVLHTYPAGKTGDEYTIPDSVTSIGNGAFIGCTSLTSITIPDSVTIIGKSAFADCTSLTAVTFLGDAPRGGARVFLEATPTIYRKPKAKGWGDTFDGRPVKLISE